MLSQHPYNQGTAQPMHEKKNLITKTILKKIQKDFIDITLFFSLSVDAVCIKRQEQTWFRDLQFCCSLYCQKRGQKKFLNDIVIFFSIRSLFQMFRFLKNFVLFVNEMKIDGSFRLLMESSVHFLKIPVVNGILPSPTLD